MSSLNPDVIQLRVLIDGSPARKELAELGQQAQEVKQAMVGLKKSSDEYAAGSAKLEAIATRQAELRKEIGTTGLSMRELNAEMGRARAIFSAAVPNTEQWAQAAARINELKDARRELTDQNRIDMRIWEATRQQYQVVSMTTEQLALETQRLKTQMARPDIGAAERGQLAAQLNLVKDRTEQLTNANRIAADAWDVQRKNIKLTDMTLEQLGMEATRLKAKLETMAPGDLGLVATRRELSLVESRAKSLQSGLGPLGRAWQGVKTQVMSAGAVIGAMFAGGAIFSGIRNLITGAAKVSDELANIQKVTGLSAAAVAQLNAQISKIDTRTATSELRGIAIGLGQVGEEATAASVSAINKINLALGSEFGSDAQAITNTISVLRNNLNDIKSTDYAKDVGQIGNAILVLGQDGLATAPVVSDIATRISGVGRQFRVTSGEILGTAAAFQELGISTERGSTAYTRLITKIAQQPQAFAEIVKKAGGDVQQFLRMVDTDMQGAFLAVARAAKVAGTENTAFAKILDDLNTQGVGVGELLSKAGANAELFAKKSDLATEALKNQNAINEQARLAEENLAGQIEKLGKEWNKVATSRTVLDWLTSIVAGTRAAVAWIRNNADAIGFLLKVVANAAVAWGTYTASVILKNRWEQISAAGMRALAGVQALLSGNISRATAAFKGFTTALRENPLGILLTVVTTAVTLFKSFSREVSTVTKEMMAQTQEMNSLYMQTLRTNQGTEKRKELIEQLKGTYPQYLSHLNSETATNAELAKAIKEVNAQVINKIVLQEQEEKLSALREAAAQAGVDEAKAQLQGMDLMRSLADKYKIDVQQATAGATNALDQLTQFRSAVIAKQKESGGSGFFKESGELSELIRSLGPLKTIYAQRNKIVEDAEKQKAQIEENLNKFKPADAKMEEQRHSLEQILEVIAKLKAELAKVPKESYEAELITNEITKLEAQAAAMRQAGGEVVRTVEQIDNEIKAITERRDKESSTSKEYAAFTKQIEALEKEKEAITGRANKQGQAKAQENLDELLRQMEQWREKMRQESLSDDEKELAQLDAKHAEELRKYKEQQQKLIAAGRLTREQANADIKRQEQLDLDERTLLMGQQADKKLAALQEANERIQQALGEQHNAELQADVQFYAEQIEQGKAANQNVVDLERKHKDALLKLYEQNALDLTAQEAKKWDELIRQAKQKLEDYDKANEKAGIDTNDPAIQAERASQLKGIADLENAKARVMKAINDKRRRDEKQAEHDFTVAIRAETIRRLQNFAQVAGSIGNLVGSITQYMDAGVQAAEMRADQDGVRTEEEIANINRLNQERRTAALIAIAVQGAIALANGIAQAMSQPWPMNLAAAISTVATVIGLIAQAKAMMNDSSSLQAPNLRQQPELEDAPLGAEGLGATGSGKVFTAADGGTVLDGPSHAEDGLRVFNPKTGKPVAEVEGGELMLILSRAATNANADLIPAMLRASKAGRRMEFLQPVQAPNPGKMQQAMRIAHFADGGAYGRLPDAAIATAAPDQSAMLHQLLLAMGRMVAGQERAAQAVEGIKDIKAVVALNHEYDRKQEEWARLKSEFTSKTKSA